jgi:sugar phosphate isomerase/epimerase
MWDVALSTMWAIGRFNHLSDFFSTGQELGFQRFELNHEVDSRMLGEVELNGYRVGSVHEPCPADISNATLRSRNWLVSATHQEGRRQGVHAVQRSIDLARELGAKAVVFHAGRVDVDAQLERELWDLFETGQRATSAYDDMREKLVAARAARAGPSLEAARLSLIELAEYAGRFGIRLGAENRYHYLDIPLPDEMEVLLSATGDDGVGFWYDVGHAETLARLGFIAHEEWLRRFTPRMMGVHLHDIRGIKDHFAAGLGDVDWEMVAGYLPEQAIRTCEFRAFNTPQQVAEALHFLDDKGCISRAGSTP